MTLSNEETTVVEDDEDEEEEAREGALRYSGIVTFYLIQLDINYELSKMCECSPSDIMR